MAKRALANLKEHAKALLSYTDAGSADFVLSQIQRLEQTHFVSQFARKATGIAYIYTFISLSSDTSMYCLLFDLVAYLFFFSFLGGP